MGHAGGQDLPTLPQRCGGHAGPQVLPGLLQMVKVQPEWPSWSPPLGGVATCVYFVGSVYPFSVCVCVFGSGSGQILCC